MKYNIFKWKYNTANSWGTDSVTGQSGLGYGPQEQFYGTFITLLLINLQYSIIFYLFFLFIRLC